LEKLTRNRRSDDVEEDDVMEPLNDYKTLLKKWFQENFMIVSNEEEIVAIGDLKNMFDKSKMSPAKCGNLAFSNLAHDVFPKLKSKQIMIKWAISLHNLLNVVAEKGMKMLFVSAW